MILDFGWEKPIVMQDAKHDEVPVAYIQVGVYRMALLVIYYVVVGFLPLPQSPLTMASPTIAGQSGEVTVM